MEGKRKGMNAATLSGRPYHVKGDQHQPILKTNDNLHYNFADKGKKYTQVQLLCFSALNTQALAFRHAADVGNACTNPVCRLLCTRVPSRLSSRPTLVDTTPLTAVGSLF